MIRRDDIGLEQVLKQLSRRGAGGFEWYKDSCLLRRIEVRMRARSINTLAGYAALLEDDAQELDRLLHTLSVRVTGFFRNPDTWKRLREVLSEATTERGQGLRAWSMGCATGEESWSLAMLLVDLARYTGPEGMRAVHVVASDVDDQALAFAARGQYPPESAQTIAALVTRPYGSIGATGFEVDPELRALVTFRREDLTARRHSEERFDVVCCRNVLIFLGREGQRRVLDTAVRGLRPGGVLALGRTESLVALPDAGLEPIDLTHRLYRRLP